MMNMKKKNIIKIIAALSLVLFLYNSRVSLGVFLAYYTFPFRETSSSHILNHTHYIVWQNYEHNGLLSIYDLLEEEPNLNLNFSSRAYVNFKEEVRGELRNRQTMLNRFFSMDRRTGIIYEYLDIDYFLDTDLRIEKNSSVPQVLIFHTHAMSEFFIDGGYDIMDGIVGVGDTLTYHLRNLGLNVIHYRGVYDMVDGRIHRAGAYERIEPSIASILEQHPTIELVLDIHRDGVPETTARSVFVRYVNGLEVAAIMFVNGFSAVNENGTARRLSNIPNNYVRRNMALTFNMQMALNYYFGDITRRMFLTPFRYINHLRPNSMLIEVGTQLNTRQEAHNAMLPLAHTLYSVLFYSN